jgi:UDP-N-acetylmuramoyl-tripeptide--D-alanyl-D-alanine ligase
MDIKDIYTLFEKEPTVSTDSRSKAIGGLFFALKGESFNGNKFAHLAIENGASYAIIDEKEYWKDDRFIVVDNVLQTLQKLANYHRQTFSIPVIGITGTNGKTTTKELINAVLSKKYKTVCTKGNLNNHIGVPLTLLSIPKDAEIAIIEMGANHPLEISELCEIANPNYGIISSIGKAHLEGFGSFENIIKTKKELYDHIAKQNNQVFVNHNDELLLSLSSNLNCIYYGSDDSIYCKGEYITSNPFVSIALFENGNKTIVQSQMIGSYNTNNMLAAACVGKKFGMSISEIKVALEAYTPDNNRSQLKITEHNTLLLDAYNANPSSMEASITNFKGLAAEHKVVILGEMLELGDVSNFEHEKLYDQVISCDFDEVYLVGQWKNVKGKNVLFFENTLALIEYLFSHRINGKTILIKGSRGNKLETIVEFL